MTWFKVDDSFHSHPKVRKVLTDDPSALGLWVLAGSWSTCHATGGFIPAGVPKYLLPRGDQIADVLVRANLWRRARRGWQMAESLSAVPGSKPLPLWAIERDDYRKKIPQDVRDLVFRRDGDRCVECGVTDDPPLDHIKPWSKGGPDTAANLRVLCRPCNSRKGAGV